MRQGGGREEELWKKWQKKINLGQKVAIFKTLQESGKCWKTAISRCQGGDRMKIFLKSSILLGGPKMALGRTTYYGGNQPMDIPPFPPLPTYAPPFLPLLFGLPLVAVAAWTERPQGGRKFSRRRTEKILYFKKEGRIFCRSTFFLSFFIFWLSRLVLPEQPPPPREIPNQIDRKLD